MKFLFVGLVDALITDFVKILFVGLVDALTDFVKFLFLGLVDECGIGHASVYG